MKILIKLFKAVSWKELGILAILLFFEVSMHPLGIGPDRRIHDPAVYRSADSTYMTGDWYTDMASESKVYIFYAKLIQTGNWLSFSEEAWRLCLYVVCLVITYYSLIKIAQIFTNNLLIVPLIALVHAFFMLYERPVWLYGPFLHIDGGLAPRSIGVAFSFLALLLLLKKKPIAPWVVLGIATLIHVSNSLLVFTLFLLAHIVNTWSNNMPIVSWSGSVYQSLRKWLFALMVYIFSGGWFAIYAAIQNSGEHVSSFTTEKFVWAWVYFRAPYMDLTGVTGYWKIFCIHVLIMVLGWIFLSRSISKEKHSSLNLIMFVGVGSILYFFIFYVFAFIYPWLPGFQFYSMRVIYFLYFCSYAFGALVVVIAGSLIQKRLFHEKNLARVFYPAYFVSILVVMFSVASHLSISKMYTAHAVKNITISYKYLLHPSFQKLDSPIERFLLDTRQSFLAPPDWYGSPQYVPHIASFKTFGFTPKGLEEWYGRLNVLSRGELDKQYEKQLKHAQFRPIFINWNEMYRKLTADEVVSLSEKYGFNYFVTYSGGTFPFKLMVDDTNYRLYKIKE